MAFRALEAMQRLDALISRPIQRMQLPAMLEDALAYPDGECLFGKDTAFTTCWVSCALAQCVWPGAMAPGLSCTMSSYLAMVLGKFAFPRQRPDPDSVGLAPRTASGLAARSRFADAPALGPRWLATSFPSGCATIATGFGAFFAEWTGSPLWYAVPAVASFARVYFCCHWVGDTLFGAALGYGVVRTIVARAGPLGLRSISAASPLCYVPTVLLSLLLTAKHFKDRKLAREASTPPDTKPPR